MHLLAMEKSEASRKLENREAIVVRVGGLKKGVRVTYFLNGEQKVTIFPYASVIKLQGTAGP